MTIAADLDSVIFMKVGRHAGEDFDQILERKRREYEQTGMIFWGYGGGTMHPIQRVQPFVRMRVEHGQRVVIVMKEVDSRHPDTEVYATEYSRDGVHWEAIPEGVRVRGSRYALVLDEIREGDLTLDLNRYQVGVGPSAGKRASNYIRGRVDKGCLDRLEIGQGEEHRNAENQAEGGNIIRVQHIATLREPFAVLLRS